MAGLGKIYGRLVPSFRRLCQNYTKDDVIFRSMLSKRQFHKDSHLSAINLEMPALSPTMTKGNIIKWHKKEGDTITAGDVLCEIETDKAVMSMDTEEEGILAKIIIPDNSQDVAVGRLIALIVEEGEDWKNVEVPSDAGAGAAAAAPSKAAVAETTTDAKPAASSGADHVEGGHLIGPSVKKLLQEYSISPASVTASGPSGALLKGDVLNYIKAQNLNKVEQKAAAPVAPSAPAPAAAAPSTLPPPPPMAAPGANYVDIPLTNMRRTIAKRLTESKTTIPHAYASIVSDIGSVSDLRQSLAAEGVKVSMNDFIIKAVALALKRVPHVNGIWSNETAQLSSSADISIAVATPSGLITPIVKGASNLSVDQIRDTVKELAGRAREGKLKPEEYQGGSFSISNLGMFGISEFTAVINPPQMAILAIGTSRDVASMNGNRKKMTVTLSHDSRAINESEATRFLEEFRNVLENPQSMLAGTNLDAEAEAFAF